MTTNFGGYNHTPMCVEGEFFDMRNMTAEYYPILSPRNPRGIGKSFEALQGILDKEKLVWIDNKVLYIDGEVKSLGDIILSDGMKDMYKMGAYIVILPDRVWFNAESGECGQIDNEVYIAEGAQVSFTLCSGDGKAVTWYDEDHKPATPSNGDYMMVTTDGKSSLKVYSKYTNMWNTVTTTYIKISAQGIGAGFKKEDGVKVIVDNTKAEWDYCDKIFVNDEGDGKHSIVAPIFDIGDDYITIPAILKENKTFTNMALTIERKMPAVKYLTECQNRLWGCSEDGHEIYCCKLGDVTNWNYFTGVSIDSYSATVGSDGVFTGCITYNQNPIFFKEHSFLKVQVSASGAHSYREQTDYGVQNGSYKSLVNVNGVLYFKGLTDIYICDGSAPLPVSNEFGDHSFSEAVGGTIDGRYYVSMKGEDGKYRIFVHDYEKGIWVAEDEKKVDFYCKHADDLYMVVGNEIYSVQGGDIYESTEKEKPFEWSAESAPIGYALPDSKYIGRINIRMSIDLGAYADFWMKYDDDERWTHIFNMAGSGTNSFTIPVTPRRCDHFKYRISGKGKCKVYSVTKTIEEGSDK